MKSGWEREDVTWCWLVLIVNCREIQQVCSGLTQQVCSLLWKGYREEPCLWVVHGKAEVSDLLTSLSSPISYWSNFCPLESYFLHPFGLYHLAPRKPDSSPTEWCFIQALGGWPVEHRWGINQNRRRQWMETLERAQGLCPSTWTLKHWVCSGHLTLVSDFDDVSVSRVSPANEFYSTVTLRRTFQVISAN